MADWQDMVAIDDELSAPVLPAHWLTFSARMPPLFGWPMVG